jgi:hypothetical protein
MIIPVIVFSQNDPKAEFKNKLDVLFQQMDKSKITSGLLSDYAVELAEIAPFNGLLSDTNYVDASTWVKLYCSIYDAKINNLISLKTPETVSNLFQNATGSNNAIPLAMMHYTYDKLDDDALSKGWVTYTGGRIRDVSGKPSPYLKKNLFAVAPQSVVLEGKTVSFVFKSGLFFRNNSKSILKREINFNNESGYRTVAWDAPLSYTFASGGEKTIYFKLTYSDGSIFISQSRIYVNDNVSLRAAAASLTDAKIPLDANSAHSGGTLEIHYASKNTSKKLQKPLIIAEPFDMSSVLSVFPDYTLDKIFDIPGIQPVRAMIDSLQYDIVYVNYKNGLDDIFRNAALFKEALRKVNSLKDKSINCPNLVLGISMGGLVARYALRSMEIAGEDHDTWKYISLDSPHKGANLPLGLQGLIRDIEGFSISIFGFSVWESTNTIKILDELYGVLNAKATRQMLIYYCDKNMNIDNREHENFQKEYDRVGFPLKCQNIAVSSGNTKGDVLFAPSTQLFNWTDAKHFNALESLGIEIGAIFGALLNVEIGKLSAFKLFLQNYVMGNSALKAEFNIDALPDKKVARIYNGHVYFKKWILWLIPVTPDISRKELYTKDYMLPLDGSAGSFNGFKGVEDDDKNFKIILDQFKKKEFTFVPTSSSLALSNWQELVNKDIRNRDFYAEGLSEFEYSLCTSNISYQHGDFAFAATFLAQHLASPPVSFNLASIGFSTSALIPLRNPGKVPVSWSVSNSNFSLTNTSNTSATLVCDKSNITGIITVKNTVQVPPQTASAMGISSSFQMQQRKRMQSLSVASIAGAFQEGSPTATLRVANLQAGIPVSWTLSDNSNFKIVSSAADSAVIQALSYSKTITVTATLLLQGKQLPIKKQLISPALSFSPPLLNCQETEIAIATVLPNYESIEWSVATSDKYIKIAGTANKPAVKVYGVQNTGNSDSSKGKLTVKVKVNGETITYAKTISVAIPEKVNLNVIRAWTSDQVPSLPKGMKGALIQAKASPHNDKGVIYRWRSSNGTLVPCGGQGQLSTNNIKDVGRIFVNTKENQLSGADISTGLLRSLVSELSEDMKEDLKEEDIVVTRAATVSNSAGGINAVVLGVSKKSVSLENTLSANSVSSATVKSSSLTVQNNSLATTVQSPEKYVTIYNPDGPCVIPADLPPMADTESPYNIPTDDPSYAVIYYSENDVTVFCDFISPCNVPLTASVTISGGWFFLYYAPGSHSITISNDDLGGNSGSSTGNNNTGQRQPYTYYDQLTGQYVTIYPVDIDSNYKVYIYNDYGLVKQTEFKSSLGTISIPMNGHPNGFYYVNIVDSQGNVVKRQTVQVQ